MATLNLGRIKPIFKGAYAGGTAYVVDDIVTSGNETFICILASTGNATSNATYWTKLASKGADGSNGSNGTDISTTLTTQGDILYRDGSGLQRLAKGSASQTLQMNSGANAPTWTTAEGGTHVKIATLDYSSDVTSVTLTDCFSSDYQVYKLYMLDLHSSGNNQEIRFNFRNSGGSNLGSNYSMAVGSYNQTSGSTGGSTYFTLANDANIRLFDNYVDTVAAQPTNLEMTIYNPYENDVSTSVAFSVLSRAANNYYYTYYGAAHCQDTSSARSLNFFLNGGNNFRGYKTTIYGIKR